MNCNVEGKGDVLRYSIRPEAATITYLFKNLTLTTRTRKRKTNLDRRLTAEMWVQELEANNEHVHHTAKLNSLHRGKILYMIIY